MRILAHIQISEIAVLLAAATTFLGAITKVISSINKTIEQLKYNARQVEDLKVKFDRLNQNGSQPMQQVLAQLRNSNAHISDVKEKAEAKNGD